MMQIMPNARRLATIAQMIAFLVVAASLVFMPLAFGGVRPASWLVICAAASALATCLLLFAIDRPLRWTVAHTLLAGGLLLGVLQLCPMPGAMVATLSPDAAQAQAFVSDHVDPAEHPTARTLSVYPRGTRAAIGALGVAITFFLVARHLFAEERYIRRVLAVISVIGAALGVYTIVQTLIGNGRFYWVIESPYARGVSGTFVNHNHLAHFLNLSIGAMLALLLTHVDRIRRAGEMRGGFYRLLIDERGRVVALLVVAVVWTSIAVVLSGSRGGILALVAASVFLGLMMVRRRRLRHAAKIAAGVGLLALMVLSMFQVDTLFEDFGKIGGAYEGRSAIVADAKGLIADYPMVGAGLGTFAYAFPGYQERFSSDRWAMHAENDYAEVVAESGVAGLTLLASMIGLVGWRFTRLVSGRPRPHQQAAYGIAFSLVTVLVHSVGDFGERLPANFCVTALLVGLLLAMAEEDRRSDERTKPSRKRRQRGSSAVGFAMAAAVVLLMGWSLNEAYRYDLAASSWQEARVIAQHLERAGWNSNPKLWQRLVNSAESSIAADPGNIEYRLALNAFRLERMTRRWVAGRSRSGLPVDDRGQLDQVRSDAVAACQVAPTCGPSFSLLGQIEWAYGRIEHATALIHHGYALAPMNARACLTLGRLTAASGDVDGAYERVANAVRLEPQQLRTAVYILYVGGGRLDLLERLVKGDWDRAFRASWIMQESNAPKADVAMVRADAIKELTAVCQNPYAKPEDLARLAFELGNIGVREDAAVYYKRAIQFRGDNADWRFKRARLLVELERYDEAREEISICLQLQPEWPQAREMLDALRRREK
ncbi:MAG: hypothetical protein GC159_17000 [Phycisphaera sp.]|nr:hypothetical protein [Phycisphaera sp.]